jgi:acetyltransferase
MINHQLIHPESIVVLGGSNNTRKPGGKILKNLIDGGFKGTIHIVNPKEDIVQGIACFKSVDEVPETQMAILSIPAKSCVEAVDVLATRKNTKAFIIVSAGFSEESEEGALLEKKIAEIITNNNGCLIGPNCIGVLTPSHHSLFTSPIPRLDPMGCDLISSSGATAVFIMESGITKGLRFSSVFSVGNSAQNGVEDVLRYFDETFDPEKSSRIKLLYIESIKDPDSLLFHASSLIRKGCTIAAIKAGTSDAGSRAALSHTGALASSDAAVEALFRKAGIVRCHGREELTTVASIFMHKKLKGKSIAIITQAGGPAVMLTDALSRGGLEIPKLHDIDAAEIKQMLFPGSSAQNPIDLLATGTAEQLGAVIDYCEHKIDYVDAMMVIFGSPGLVEVFDAYEVLHQKMAECKKPIFPVLPSIITASKETEFFIEKGHVNFPDEVSLGSALIKVFNTPAPAAEITTFPELDIQQLRNIIDESINGFLPPRAIQQLLNTAGIPFVKEKVSANKDEILFAACEMGYPVVVKVVGPIHKSDIGGVSLNVKSEKHLAVEFDHMMSLPGAVAVQVQPMLSGKELFIGAKYEPRFGHVILCGLGGIFVEVLEDFSSGLAPLTYDEAFSMIRSLRSYKIFKGTRGQQGINEEQFAGIIVKLSALLRLATEIKELDFNPLIATPEGITVVDARVRVEK